MNEEIKEILGILRRCTYCNEVYLIKEHGATLLLDYITNLQEELEVAQDNEESYRLEMQDITKALTLDEHTLFDDVKDYATNLQQENERLKEKSINEVLKNDFDMCVKDLKKANKKIEKLEDYKSRCEKAVEYGNNCLENLKDQENYICESIDVVELLKMIHKNYINILNGRSDE